MSRIATPPLLYTVTAAAQVLGMDRKTVGKMCARFELAWVPSGERYGKHKERINKRIPLTELQRWIRAHTVHDAAELRQALDGRKP